MQIVIDISKDDYRKVQDGRANVSMMQKAIRNGTPLPKGHGRLIDADDLMEIYSQFEFCSDMGDAMEILDHKPTIIEADTESEE